LTRLLNCSPSDELTPQQIFSFLPCRSAAENIPSIP
jgi:hypothetical protein